MGAAAPRPPAACHPRGAMMPAFHSLVGRRVDRYEVLAQLGQGGFGAVYRARHAMLGTEVALKVLWPERADDPGAVERFMREARAAASIGSPHIVRVGDAGTTADGVVFLAMELLHGHDLERELRARRRLSPYEASDILRQVLAALGAAHAAGIVHRDLKPANVFLVPGPDGAPFVKLLDFGVSKMKGARSLTGSGIALGTPQYMAPEQIEGAREIDGRVDVYAAGCMLYEMLSGRLPFEGSGVELLVRRLSGERPPELRSIAPDVPPALAAVVHRALAFDRDARFASAAAMADALLAAEEGAPPPEAAATVPPAARWVTPAAPPADPYAPTGATPVDLAAGAPPPSSGARPVGWASAQFGERPTVASDAAPRSAPPPQVPAQAAPAPASSGALRVAALGALGALALVLAAGAGALGVGAYRRFARVPPVPTVPHAAEPSASHEEPAPVPAPAPPSSDRAAPAPAAPPIDPAGIRYQVLDVVGLGPRSEVDALLERARPGVARCASSEPLHLAVHFIGTIGGHVTVSGPSQQRVSDDVAAASCVGRAIADAGPMHFSGWQTAIVELDVDLPGRP